MLGNAFITLDVTHIPPEDAQPGEPDDLVGGPQLLDALSVEAMNFGYEILTSLGSRNQRSYMEKGHLRGKAAS